VRSIATAALSALLVLLGLALARVPTRS